MRNLQMRTWRFNELKKDLEGISQKVLTDSLRSMEKDGIVVRTVYAEVPPRVEYSLSDLGKSMHPIIDAMADWGRAYQQMVNNPHGKKQCGFCIIKAVWRLPYRFKFFLISH